MKSVIRVQDAEGRGMFYNTVINDTCNTSVYAIYELDGLCERHTRFPDAEKDKIISIAFTAISLETANEESSILAKRKWRFSFKNLEQFEKWVTRDEVKILTDYGYRIVRVFASSVIIGEYQNIFN